MDQIPKIEGKSILSLIFNIHNSSALDFIRLWSGLYHQLYAAYHMHIKCREPAVLDRIILELQTVLDFSS